MIAGCSIGALVGAAFAAGRLDQVEAWALAFDWKSMLGLLDIRLRGGLIKGARVADFIREQFLEREFSDLAVPFAAVATDVTSGREIRLPCRCAARWARTPSSRWTSTPESSGAARAGTARNR